MDILTSPLAKAVLAFGFALCLYSLAELSSETKRLAHIHTLGHGNFILSYWSALQFLCDPPGWLRREWTKIPHGTKFVKTPGLLQWIVHPVSPEGYKDIGYAPDHALSLSAATENFLQANYTMYHKEIGDALEVPVIQSKLNRSMGEVVPQVHEEMVLAFRESFPLKDNDWRSFVVWPELLKIIARISNRAFVGLPLCRDPEYISINVDYANDVLFEAYTLVFVPPFLRSLVHRWLSPIPSRLESITRWAQPLIDKHRDRKEKYGDDAPEDQNSVLEWFADSAEKGHRGDRDAILRLMSVNFGSIHTGTITFSHALYSLVSRPHLIEPLREEVDRCVEEYGWTKDATDNMVLVDSFIKESHRYDIMGAMNGHRLAIKDYTLSDVFIPKGTLVAQNLLAGHFDQAMWGPTADEFDPYRFVKFEEETGQKLSIVTTTVNNMTFGHGRHACPGRFLAAQEQKLMLAYFVHEYDLKIDNEDGTRPKNMWLGMSCVPNRSGRLLLRRRAGNASSTC